uniref:Uncharacterized protein n=1 Tax=Arundo donax TaxID=35708 RepID=A0A0A8ZWR0_ARUDO
MAGAAAWATPPQTRPPGDAPQRGGAAAAEWKGETRP